MTREVVTLISERSPRSQRILGLLFDHIASLESLAGRGWWILRSLELGHSFSPTVDW